MLILAATGVNVVVIVLAVLIHYECLVWLSQHMPKHLAKPRFRLVFGVLGALMAHSIEVWLFALAYYLMLHFGDWGQFTGAFDGSIWDCVYFSYTSYTTLGYGDISPHGMLRYLAGVESLTGLVLITWTASFLYSQMQRHWYKVQDTTID